MPIAVLVMAYGTPAGPDEVEAFYTDVRRGRPPSPEQLADLERRYAAIGGVSPLTERTRAQIAALQRALDARAPGTYRAYHGTKHARPSIADAITRAVDDGADGLVGFVLAPHYSRLSIGEYIERAEELAAAAGLRAAFIEHWHDEPVLVELLAERVGRARSSIASPPAATVVCFSAHSLPARILALDDPYPGEVAHTAALVAKSAGLEEYRVVWQSAGRTPEPWLGPDVLAVIDEIADAGAHAVLVSPVGFTSDHLEILYDLDIEASARARARGLEFARTPSLNDEPRLFDALAERVIALAGPLAHR